MADDLAVRLRRRDPDRWFTTLFAPEPARATLVTLYAFNNELARAREVTREPGLALIRLHWWREVVEGAAKPHEVATPLSRALEEGRLHAPHLLAMIDARDLEAEGEFGTTRHWLNWLLNGAGSLAVAAGRALGAPVTALDRLRALGAGYALAGQLRNISAVARQGRCLLPADVLSEHGLSASSVLADPHTAGIAAVRAALARQGMQLLGQAQPCSAPWVAAALPAILGRRDLAHPGRSGPRGVADRVAVTIAALRRVA